MNCQVQNRTINQTINGMHPRASPGPKILRLRRRVLTQQGASPKPTSVGDEFSGDFSTKISPSNNFIFLISPPTSRSATSEKSSFPSLDMFVDLNTNKPLPLTAGLPHTPASQVSSTSLNFFVGQLVFIFLDFG